MTDTRTAVDKALGSAEELAVGSGTLDLGLRADTKSAGAMLDYEHHVTTHVSAFAHAGAGWVFDTNEFTAEALTGIRIRF